MINIRHWLILWAGLFLVAACGSPQPSQPTPPSAATVEAAANTPADTPGVSAPTESGSPAAEAACPQPGEGTVLYESRENGFCFLYPSDLQLRPDPRFSQDAVQLIGAPLDPGAMESIALNLGVFYNGPADGLDSAQYAAKWAEYNAQSMELVQTDAVIGNQPAVVIDNLPGMMNQRAAFVVANGVKYQITLVPQPQDVPDLADAAAHAWDTITQSFVFFPPGRTDAVVRPADVCPAAAADTKLMLGEVGGYCFLYPADFERDTMFSGTITGGPELGPYADFSSLRAALTVGGSYPLAEMTPEQVLQPGTENNDPNSFVSTTLGGYPAVTYDFVAGPWRQRNAAVVVDDRYYTFVIQPWDPDLFPQAVPDVERLWNTVSQSLAFFDPWR